MCIASRQPSVCGTLPSQRRRRAPPSSTEGGASGLPIVGRRCLQRRTRQFPAAVTIVRPPASTMLAVTCGVLEVSMKVAEMAVAPAAMSSGSLSKSNSTSSPTVALAGEAAEFVPELTVALYVPRVRSFPSTEIFERPLVRSSQRRRSSAALDEPEASDRESDSRADANSPEVGPVALSESPQAMNAARAVTTGTAKFWMIAWCAPLVVVPCAESHSLRGRLR